MPQPKRAVKQKIKHLDHLRLAEHNEQFAKHLAGIRSGFKDWIITACFYSARHYLISQMQKVENLPITHPEFLSLVYKHFPVTVYQKARFLYDKSIAARYFPAYADRYRRGEKYHSKCLDILEKLKIELKLN